MTRRSATLLVLAALLLPGGLALGVAAPPAEARGPAAARPTKPVVEDPEGLLDPARAKALQGKLARVPLAGVAVVYASREGRGIERQAEDAFRRLALGPGALSVAIAVDDRKVAAHVGRDLRARGIDRTVIQAAINDHFKAHARAGRYDDGAFALVDALARHEGRSTATEERRDPAPASPPAESESVPWWALALTLILGLGTILMPFVLVGGLIWFVVRRFMRQEKAATEARTRARVDAIEAARDRIMAGVVALDGAIALARGAGVDPSQATATAVMAEAQAFAARVEAVAKAFPAPSAGAEAAEIDALEMIALNLEVSTAALRTAYETGAHDAFRDALKLGRRWKLVDAQVALLVEKGHGTGQERAVLVDLVAKAREALTGVPQDLPHATALIGEAETTLEALGLTKIEEPATSATARVPAASSHHHLDGWDTTPVHACVVAHAVSSYAHHHAHHDHHTSSHHDDHHDHHDSTSSDHSDASSGSGWWGGSSSSSDSGSSSWGSSSDDDSNRWSSSDSGSSSWDSGSSSSSDSSSSSGSDSW